MVSQENTLQLKEMRMKRWGMVGAQVLMLRMSNLAHAGGLGVTGDSFLSTYASWVPTTMFLAGLVGIAVWLSSGSDYGQGLLAGSTAVITRCIIGGGAVAILGFTGLSMGAILN